MSSPKVVEACQNLFSITSCLAQGILPALRMEDVKIALAKQLHKTKTLSPADKSTNNPELLLSSYAILTDYIQQNNLDVILALEYCNNSKPNEESYLYPLTGKFKITSSKHSDALSKRDLFFKGTLPPRKLRFGTFLYYKGLISYYNVMESIAWQKDRRPLLGQIAMQIGQLTTENFARAIIAVKNGDSFGAFARKNNFLSDHVVAAIVKAQEKYDCRIGRYFIEKSILSGDNIFELHKEMAGHNGRYGTSHLG